MILIEKVIIGVDIGGSKILSGILTREGRILVSKKEPTLAFRDSDEILDNISFTVRGLIQDIGVQPEDILGIAVGAPGPLDWAKGIIKDPPYLGWRNLPLRDELGKRLGRQLLLENDANLAALGEWKHGGSKAFQHLIFMTVSTGIGGGIIIDGRLYRGRDGAAGEFGRIRMEGQASASGYAPGLNLESLASGTALAHEAEELIKQGQGQAIRALCSPGAPVTACEIGAAARNGDQKAQAIIERAGQRIGIAAANLINIFNPDRFIIGGGMGLGLQEFLSQPIQESLNKLVSPSLGHDLKIEFSTMGDNNVLLGCVAAVLQEAEKGTLDAATRGNFYD